MDRTNIKYMREAELTRLRIGKRGRPYQPIKHFDRETLNEMRDIKLAELENLKIKVI